MTAQEEFQQQLDRRLRTTSREHGYDGETGTALTAWQETVRDQLETVLGFPALRAAGSCDPEPELRETVVRDGYERQRWHIRTEPGMCIPFYLLVPEDSEQPCPVVLTIHGHCEDGKELTVGNVADDRPEITEERRDFARQAVQRGYAALAPDMRAFGELTKPESEPDADGYRSCTRLQKTAQLFDRTLAGERTWDVLCLVDFIVNEPMLDANRIAITGHSGGAAVSLFAAAVDDRLAPVALNSYFCTFEDSIVAIDHCECNYVPGIVRLGEMWDIAGAIAPRPLAVITGDDDPIFPVDGTKRAFARLQTIYRNAGVRNACELSVGAGAHRFYPDHVWPSIEAHL